MKFLALVTLMFLSLQFRDVRAESPISELLPNDVIQEIVVRTPSWDNWNAWRMTSSRTRKILLGETPIITLDPRTQVLSPIDRILRSKDFKTRISDFEWRKKKIRQLLDPSTQFVSFSGTEFESLRGDKIHLSPYKLQRIPITELLWTLVMWDTLQLTPLEEAKPEQKERIPGLFTVEELGLKIYPYLPVTKKTWQDCANAFPEKLKKYGIHARLPTSAEWENAAFHALKEKVQLTWQDGWFKENSRGRVHPVAKRAPNELGIFDLFGNVYTWVSDWEWPEQRQQPESDDLLVDPIGPERGQHKVIRGSSFLTPLRAAAETSISSSMPHTNLSGYQSIGCRLVLLGIEE